MEKYFVYILYSLQKDKYYVGHTQDVEVRIQKHRVQKNLGASDWVLKYSEEYATRAQSVKRELEIKKKKSRKYIEWLITNRN